MDYSEAIAKCNELKESFYKLHWDHSQTDKDRENLKEKVAILYGEIEDIYIRIVGIQKVEVTGGRGQKSVYSNYLEAAILSAWTLWLTEGYRELLKVIGKLDQLKKNPAPLVIEHSITELVRTLRRFRECCQYIKEAPSNEKAVQDIMWIMIRSQFDRVDREETLSKFGVKNYRPDFGIPDLNVLIEAKFIGENTIVPRIQEEILADVPAYLNDSSKYKSLIVLIYDEAQKLRDSVKFIEDLKSISGIIEVSVVPGIS
jgi:hypothetical protein